MILADVNVWVFAFRADTDQHEAYRAWVQSLLAGPNPFAVADIILAGFLRVVTHPRVYRQPSPIAEATRFVEVLRQSSFCVRLAPGERHWQIFIRLCRATQACGNAVPDAYLAALAIEHGCEWASADRGFRRFPGLRGRHPLD